MEAREFGARLRELRLKAHLSLRELAEQVGIDFTYLCKIENGVMPPPSEKVIRALAETLGAESDELFALAAKIPSELAGVLKNGETWKFLRSRQSRKTRQRKLSLPSSRSLATSYRKFSKVAVAVALVLAIGTTLWFASPVKALDIDISTPLPATISNVVFTVTISLEDYDLVPITDVTLYMYKADDRATYEATCAGLPLTTGSTSYTDGQTGGGAVNVNTTAATTWDYSYGYGYAVWGGYDYHFFPPGGYGYGYGYSPGVGTTTVTYDVSWVPRTGWLTGNYKAEVKVTANGQEFTKTSATFALTSGGGGGGLPAAPPQSGYTDVRENVRPDGVFTGTVVAGSDDGNATLDIPKGTKGLTEDLDPLSSISMTTMTEEDQAALPPPTPGNIAGLDEIPADAHIVSLFYDFSPDGATFDPPATLTINYGDLPEGVTADNLVIVYWNETDGTWEALQNIVIINGTISGDLSHFTAFIVVGYEEKAPPAPATFELSQLDISPVEVEIGDEVTVTVMVTNTGGQSGSYKVILKINDIVVETEELKMNAGGSQKATFITTQDTAGTYTVNIKDKTGTFVVSEAAPPAPPAPPTPPTPAPPEAPPAPAVNWALIGGIIAGVLILALIVILLTRPRRRIE